MDRADFIAKLNAVHDFPCNYTFKIIGQNRSSLVDAALDEVRRVLPEVDPSVSRRESAKGNHQSITLELPMANAETVVLLYERFRALVGVHMLL